MIDAVVLSALTPVADTFDDLSILYLVGGSIASSFYGLPRSTLDADLMADIKASQVADLVTRLSSTYYISESAIRESLTRRSSFNLIHLATMVKIDIFIPKDGSFNQVMLERRQNIPLDKTASRLFQLTSAEDIILLKLDWFRQANGQSGETME